MYVEALDEFVEAKQGNPNASTKQILNLCLAKQGNLNASTKQIMNLHGKAKQPKCFHKTNHESLPVTNRSNKKAWMSSKLYEKYLQILNRKLKRQKKEKKKFIC